MLLVGATLLSSTAMAAPTTTTRHLFVGSDPTYADATNGIVTFTPVSTGATSATTVYVKSLDNQNLTHVVVTFAQAQTSGVTIGDTAYGTDRSFCSAVNGVMTCDFGNVKARSLRTFILVLTAPATITPTPPATTQSFAVVGKVVFNESNNPNGGNDQINDITGAMEVSLSTCDAVATFLPPGQVKAVEPSADCPIGTQRSWLDFVKNDNGTAASVDDSNPIATVDCPTGFSCFGQEVRATVNGGATIDPYLTWKITYSAAVMKGINPKQVGFQHGDALPILPGKKGTCGASFTGDCIVGFVVNADGSVTFTIRTSTNTTMRGVH
jgi:hypothetical protein